MENAYILGGLRSYVGVVNGIYRHIPAEVLGAEVLKQVMEKYQLRGKERGWYEDQGEEYLFIKAPAVSCGESERKREKNSVNMSNCDH